VASDNPNSLSLFSDYAKTTITLASGILAITATFASSLVSSGSGLAVWWLIASWLALAVSIGFSIFLAGGVINESRSIEKGETRTVDAKKASWNKLAFLSNAAFWSLAAGLVLLFVFVGVEQFRIKEAVKFSIAWQALSSTRAPCGSPGGWTLRSAHYDSGKGRWHLIAAATCGTREPRTALWFITVSKGAITSIRQ
jgi:hypothetical protein